MATPAGRAVRYNLSGICLPLHYRLIPKRISASIPVAVPSSNIDTLKKYLIFKLVNSPI